jgi:signal transduction histidine kinase
VEGDRVRLEQVFTNLLQNAFKYSPQGGQVSVVIERSEIHASPASPYVVVRVTDSGSGIAAEMLSRVFELFARQERGVGLAIGLNLVRGLVELHGGRVEVHSAGSGGGSEFTVFLPVTHRGGAVKPLAGEIP